MQRGGGRKKPRGFIGAHKQAAGRVGGGGGGIREREQISPGQSDFF